MNLKRIVNYALENGANEAEITKIKTISRVAKLLGEKLTTTSSIQIETIIRIIVGKSIASIKVSSSEEAILKDSVDKAISIAKNSPPDPYWEGLTSGGKPTADKLEIWNEDLANLDIKTMVNYLNNDLKYAKNIADNIKIVGISYNYNESEIMITNSNGVDAEDKINGLFFLIETKGKKNGYEASTFGYTRGREPTLNTEQVIENTISRNKELLNAEKYQGIYDQAIALDPLATATTLFFSIARVITGTAVMEGYSPFKDKLGDEITSRNLTLIDNGILRGGWNSRVYDDEGYPRGTTKIIENGVLNAFIHNSYTAKRLGQSNTGNAVRRGTTLTVGITNLIIKGKTKQYNKLLSSYDELILVRNMPMNAHTTNYITGALNMVATEVYYIKKGTIEKVLKPMTLSGNIYQSLMRLELGDDYEDTFYNVITPTIVLEGLKMA